MTIESDSKEPSGEKEESERGEILANMSFCENSRMRTVGEWKSALRAALKEALRERDSSSVSMYRETLAAIDNAEAPDLRHAPAATSLAIAGAVVGLGAGDIPRLALSPEDVAAIVQRELRERRDAAASYDTLGRAEEAATLRGQADRLAALLDA
jgi:uncharacterized protein YqeY